MRTYKRKKPYDRPLIGQIPCPYLNDGTTSVVTVYYRIDPINSFSFLNLRRKVKCKLKEKLKGEDRDCEEKCKLAYFKPRFPQHPRYP